MTITFNFIRYLFTTSPPYTEQKILSRIFRNYGFPNNLSETSIKNLWYPLSPDFGTELSFHVFKRVLLSKLQH